MKNTFFLLVALLTAAAFCQCPQGSYSSDGTDNAQGGCISCPIGKTTISAGTIAADYSLACTIDLCPKGSYSFDGTWNAQGGCISCPFGKTTISDGTIASDSALACTIDLLCPKGSYSLDGTKNAQGGCISCGSLLTTRNAGTVSNDDSVCGYEFCPKGSYSSNGTSVGNRCIYCQNGKTTIGIGTIGTDQNSACVITTQPCPKGSYSSDGTDFGSCIYCGHGQTTLSSGTQYFGTAVCYLVEPCPKGSFSLNGTNLDGKCIPCDHGKTTVSTGTQGSDQNVCSVDFEPCPKGSFRLRQFWHDYPGDYDSCKPCNHEKTTESEGTEGYGLSACSVDVQPCPKNSFSYDGTNYGGCLNCPSNQITLSIGSIGIGACKTQCLKGFYSDDGTGESFRSFCGLEKQCSQCPSDKTTRGVGSIGYDSCYPKDIPENLWDTIGKRQIRPSNYFGGRIFPIDFYWSGHSELFPNGNYTFCTEQLQAYTGTYRILTLCPNGTADSETDQDLAQIQKVYSANQKKILLEPTDLTEYFKGSTFELIRHEPDSTGRIVQMVALNFNFSSDPDSSLPQLVEQPRKATPMDLVGANGYNRAVSNKNEISWNWRVIYTNNSNLRYHKIINQRYYVVSID